MPRGQSVDKELAALGARIKIQELQAQIADLKRRFPGAAGGNAKVTAPARKRGTMSAKNRAAVSARMKKYWAARRKAKGAKG
jgi:hypothetical protein